MALNEMGDDIRWLQRFDKLQIKSGLAKEIIELINSIFKQYLRVQSVFVFLIDVALTK